MLTVAEALSAIKRAVSPFPAVEVSLEAALGLVLSEEVVSDLDSPPFDKALMDGFAVRSDDLREGTGTLELIEEVFAGGTPTCRVEAGQATQIMTGAPLPEGADAVVRVEDTRSGPEPGLVRIETHPISAGTNVMRRGTSMRCGDRILPPGRRLRAQELGALAELGRSRVLVRPAPRVGVLATGDELVRIEETPGPGQIRNSNETMLIAQLKQAGAEAVPLGIARDDRSALRAAIQRGLECDLLLLSGGVSAGKLDLVPSVLEEVGVREIFHKVQVKPGKPVWFGEFVRGNGRIEDGTDEAGPEIGEGSQSARPRHRFVFGLPGNPVSSMVCFELFTRTALRLMMGIEPAEPVSVAIRLETEHLSKGDRPTYFPARVSWTHAGLVVRPVLWQGSADLRATVEANGMIRFPPGDKRYEQGEMVDVVLWEGELSTIPHVTE